MAHCTFCLCLPLSCIKYSKGSKLPRATKTGTTIVGLVFKDGIVLGADTRATGGSTVCDKNCEKIHYIAPNIRCCGAGLCLWNLSWPAPHFFFLLPRTVWRWTPWKLCWRLSGAQVLRLIPKTLLKWLHSNLTFSAWRQALSPALWQPSPDWSGISSVTRATSALLWCWVDSTIPVLTCTPYIPMAAPTNFRLWQWDLVLLPPWRYSKQVFIGTVAIQPEQ